MYDWPEIRPATDRLWNALSLRLRGAGIDAPERLDRSLDERAAWTHPHLVLGQTCGLPLSVGMAGEAVYVATPVYTAPGCAGPHYCSRVITRAGHADNAVSERGKVRAAVNASHSLSGCLALADWMVGQGRCRPHDVTWIETGSHRASMNAVAEGKADIAAIDAVAYALATKHMPEIIGQLQVIADGNQFPALPFITAAANRGIVRKIQNALTALIADAELRLVRETLHLADIAILDPKTYAPIQQQAMALQDRGWPVLLPPEGG